MWSQPISFMLPWLWSGLSQGIHVLTSALSFTQTIAQQLTSSLTCESLWNVLNNRPYLYNSFWRNLSPSDPRYDNGPYSNNITTVPIIKWSGHSGHRHLTFRTELVISTIDNSYLSAYPYDTYVLQAVREFWSVAINSVCFSYYVEISAFAQDVSTNESVILTLVESSGLIT